MSDKTNDEKLRILQERLAQIKQKSETPAPQEAIIEIEAPAPSPQREVVIETPEVKAESIDRQSSNLYWIKYVVIGIGVIGVVAFGIFYGYKNIDYFNSLISTFSSEDTVEGIVEETIPSKLTYDFELEESGVLAIISSFPDSTLAKAMVNNLKVKGYKCDYFFLPENSNSKENVYQVFIGPYDTEEETNQWAQNLEEAFEIIKL